MDHSRRSFLRMESGAEAFGYQEQENYSQRPAADWTTGAAPGKVLRPEDDRIYYQPEIEFAAPPGGKVRAHTFLTPITVTSATPIAHYRQFTVAAKKKVGKGEVYYIGTNLGASIYEGGNDGIDVLRSLIGNVARPEVRAVNLRPRIIEGPSTRSLLVVVNDSVQDQTESIALPSRYRRATDIHTGKQQDFQQGKVRVTVPYQDVAVLLLE